MKRSFYLTLALLGLICLLGRQMTMTAKAASESKHAYSPDAMQYGLANTNDGDLSVDQLLQLVPELLPRGGLRRAVELGREVILLGAQGRHMRLSFSQFPIFQALLLSLFGLTPRHHNNYI